MKNARNGKLVIKLFVILLFMVLIGVNLPCSQFSVNYGNKILSHFKWAIEHNAHFECTN